MDEKKGEEKAYVFEDALREHAVELIRAEFYGKPIWPGARLKRLAEIGQKVGKHKTTIHKWLEKLHLPIYEKALEIIAIFEPDSSWLKRAKKREAKKARMITNVAQLKEAFKKYQGQPQEAISPEANKAIREAGIQEKIAIQQNLESLNRRVNILFVSEKKQQEQLERLADLLEAVQKNYIAENAKIQIILNRDTDKAGDRIELAEDEETGQEGTHG